MQTDAEKKTHANETEEETVDFLCHQMYKTIANMSQEKWNKLCADLRFAPEVWNPNETIGEETAVFRNRKADLWYT